MQVFNYFVRNVMAINLNHNVKMLVNLVFIAKEIFNSAPKKKLIKFLILTICCFGQLMALCQNQRYQVPAFTLAKTIENTVVLYKQNSLTKVWKVVGKTSAENLNSLAIDSNNETIYAVDEGILGTLNPNTGAFSKIGEIGRGYGAKGNIKISNVQGLAFDKNRNILYASHRTDKFDILFQINPKTGKIITNSMINAKGRKADYKVIELKTFFFGGIHDIKKIVDLAYDEQNKILYITYNFYSSVHGIISYINIDEQEPKEYFKTNPITNLAGIALNREGKLFLSFSDNKITTGEKITGGGVTLDLGILNPIDANIGNRDAIFLGLDFYTDNACVNQLQLNDGLISDTPKKASQIIESSALVNFDTKFVAGKYVNLNANFEVKKSANFEILIDENACE